MQLWKGWWANSCCMRMLGCDWAAMWLPDLLRLLCVTLSFAVPMPQARHCSTA